MTEANRDWPTYQVSGEVPWSWDVEALRVSLVDAMRARLDVAERGASYTPANGAFGLLPKSGLTLYASFKAPPGLSLRDATAIGEEILDEVLPSGWGSLVCALIEAPIVAAETVLDFGGELARIPVTTFDAMVDGGGELVGAAAPVAKWLGLGLAAVAVVAIAYLGRR